MNAAGARSKLLVLAPRGSAREDLLQRLSDNGVDPTRVEFAERCPRDRYLKLYNRIDIGLDTFPYNGHTTSLDAMWMGVPVPTIVGRTAVGRAGWSQLSNVGLRDLAERSEKQWVKTAAELAQDLNRLSTLRSSLRSRLQRSPLMDAPKFARGIEAVYRATFERWAQEPPRTLVA